MGCEKIRLREIDVLECPLCMEWVEQCDECGDECGDSSVNEGGKHYCDDCWQLIANLRLLLGDKGEVI